ncbi:MAG: hypothetical protein A2992_00660 [Elusimicrobia bacterium RIFCSPLOWO2_01_FULL_59_12]|nr:MAG: hypothetical protein A2992_00660 [Elusimicrobia bacterium RIFCSPLOWO2_01_FULL_59_12]
MKKFDLWLILLSLAVPAGAAPLVAGTAEEVVTRLQRSIDRASEKGQFRQVQTLRLELAQHYTASGAFALSARQYELLLASRPSKRDRVEHSIALGKMRDADRNYSGAIAAYQDALHDDPKSWDGNLYLAKAYDHAELNSKSIEVYKRCIALKPSQAEPYRGIANVYRQLGFLSKAIQNYQKSLALEKKPEIYLELSDTYARQGDIQRAREILQEAKAGLPRAEYDVRLGHLYARHGAMKKACRAWEEALDQDTRRDDVRLQLALAYDQLSRPADSDRVFRRLLADYPRSPLVHFSRAWVLYARGDREGARQEVIQVEQLGPTAVVKHYNEKLLALLKSLS